MIHVLKNILLKTKLRRIIMKLNMTFKYYEFTRELCFNIDTINREDDANREIYSELKGEIRVLDGFKDNGHSSIHFSIPASNCKALLDLIIKFQAKHPDLLVLPSTSFVSSLSDLSKNEYIDAETAATYQSTIKSEYTLEDLKSDAYSEDSTIQSDAHESTNSDSKQESYDSKYKPNFNVLSIDATSKVYTNFDCIYISCQDRDIIGTGFIEFCKKIGVTLNRLSYSEGISCFITHEIHKYRELVDFLNTQGQLSSLNMADINSNIAQVEQNLAYRQEVTPGMSYAQEVLLSQWTYEPIEVLLNNITCVEDIIPILQNAIHESHPSRDGFKKWYNTKYPNRDDKTIASVVGAINQLNLVLTGCANLEKKLKEGSGGEFIPALQNQREEVINFILESATKKFSEKLSDYKEFYFQLSLDCLKNGEVFGYRINDLYRINDNTGMPEENPIVVTSYSRQIYTPADTVSRIKEILNRYHLKQLPVSEEDFLCQKLPQPIDMEYKSEARIAAEKLLLEIEQGLQEQNFPLRKSYFKTIKIILDALKTTDKVSADALKNAAFLERNGVLTKALIEKEFQIPDEEEFENILLYSPVAYQLIKDKLAVKYPQFLRDMNIGQRKLSPLKVANALWLSARNKAEVKLNMEAFDAWAKQQNLTFGMKEVNDLLAGYKFSEVKTAVLGQPILANKKSKISEVYQDRTDKIEEEKQVLVSVPSKDGLSDRLEEVHGCLPQSDMTQRPGVEVIENGLGQVGSDKTGRSLSADIKSSESINVVFLDILGVLLEESDGRKNGKAYDEKYDFIVQKLGDGLNELKSYDVGATLLFSPSAVQNLKMLLQQNNAKIVISSNWRNFNSKLLSQQKLRLLFKLWDLDEFIIDETPYLCTNRDVEIQRWLKETSYSINSFVILDRVSDIYPQESVITADTMFFSDSHLEKAQKILSRNKNLAPVASIKSEEERALSTLFNHVHESYFMDMDNFNIPQYGERINETLSRLVGGCKIALGWIKDITHSVWLQIEEMVGNQHDKYVLLPLLAWVARNNYADALDYPVFQYIIKKFPEATEEAMCIATYFGSTEFILRALPYITVASLKRVLETASVMDNVEVLNALVTHLNSNSSLLSQFNLNEALLLNDIGEQALYYAVRHECAKSVQLLLEHGVNPNASKTEIFTFTDSYLHLAVRGGNADIVKLLIKHGADIHAIDAWNKSLLDAAHEFKHAHLLELLGEKPKLAHNVFYPEFLKVLNLRKRKLTALSVANALWLSNMSAAEIEEQKQVFSNWAIQEGLSFGLDEVNVCLSQYDMTQRPKVAVIESGASDSVSDAKLLVKPASNPVDNNLEKIIILSARIINGPYDFVKGKYSPTNGPSKKMLEVTFSRPSLLSVNFYYIGDKYPAFDFQHTTTLQQNSFFFPIKEEMPMEKIKVWGVKSTESTENGRWRIKREVLSESELISKYLSLTERVMSFSGQKGLQALNDGKFSVDAIEKMDNSQLIVLLQKWNLHISDADLLKNIYSNDYLESLIVNNELALFKRTITLMKNTYGGINPKRSVGSTRSRTLLRAFEKLVANDDVETLQFLVNTGLEMPVCVLGEGEYDPLLVTAAKLGKINTVKFLYEQGYKNEEYSCNNALIIAIKNGHTDIVDYLLTVGISANNYSKERFAYAYLDDFHQLIYTVQQALATPINERKKFHDIFSILLKHGANLQEAVNNLRKKAHNSQNSIVLTELLLEFINDFKEQFSDEAYSKIIKVIHDTQAVIRGDKLPFALYRDDNKEAIQLIEQGASLNNYDQNFETSSISPLHVAVGKNNLVMAKFLLEHGAKVNYERRFCDEKTRFAIDIAIMKQNREMIALLLNAGAKITPEIYDNAPEEIKRFIEQAKKGQLPSGMEESYPNLMQNKTKIACSYNATEIKKENSPLNSVNVIVNIYDDFNCIYIEGKRKSGGLWLNDELVTFGKKIQVNLKPLLIVPPEVTTTEILRYRDLVEGLYKANYISIEDKTNLERNIVWIENNLSARKKVTPFINAAQKALLIKKAAPFIDELLNGMGSKEDIIPILSSALRDPSPKKEGWQQWCTLKYKHLDASTVSHLTDCVNQLAKIITGSAGLESSLEKKGDNIPALELQRKVIIESLKSKAEIRFPSSLNEYKAFYMDLSLAFLYENKTFAYRIDDEHRIENYTGFPHQEPIKKDKNFTVIYTPYAEVQTTKDMLTQHNLHKLPLSEEDFPNCKLPATTVLRDDLEIQIHSERVAYPKFLSDHKLRRSKLSALSVANALWLSKMSTAEIEEQKRVFSNWAIQEGLSFGLDEVNVCLSRYDMTQRPNVAVIENSSSESNPSELAVEMISPYKAVDSCDEITSRILVKDTLNVSQLNEKQIMSLFSDVRTEHFTTCSSIPVLRSQKRYIDLVAQVLSGVHPDGRKREDSCRVFEQALMAPTEALTAEIERQATIVDRADCLLPFFAWAAQNNRADLFALPMFRRLFQLFPSSVKIAVKIASAHNHITFVTNAIPLLRREDLIEALRVAAVFAHEDLIKSIVSELKGNAQILESLKLNKNAILSGVGDEALYCAIVNNHEMTIIYLLENGVSPTGYVDSKGRDLLSVSKEVGNTLITMYLEEYIERENAQTKKHTNPALEPETTRFGVGLLNKNSFIFWPEAHSAIDALKNCLNFVAAHTKRSQNIMVIYKKDSFGISSYLGIQDFLDPMKQIRKLNKKYFRTMDYMSYSAMEKEIINVFIDSLSSENSAMTQRPKAAVIESSASDSVSDAELSQKESSSKRVAYPRFLQEMHVKRNKVTPLSSAVAMWLTSKGQKVEVTALKETFFKWAKQEHLPVKKQEVNECLARYEFK